ncbi:hypothetical protein BX600DRAFT_476628 [Xylariales sp. PMI_506]|nr:hypothetical protein BX600DRAFT_476628 [Xylariales sp. PMI_506]
MALKSSLSIKQSPSRLRLHVSNQPGGLWRSQHGLPTLSTFIHFSSRSDARTKPTPGGKTKNQLSGFLGSRHQRRPYVCLYNSHYGRNTASWARHSLIWGFIAINGFVYYKWQTIGTVKRGKQDADGIMKPHDDFGNGVWDMPANWMCNWENLSEGRWWTLVTHTFSHQNAAHLIGNMWAWNMYTNAALVLGVGPLPIISVAFASALAGSMVGLSESNSQNGEGRGMFGSTALICGVASYVTCFAPRWPLSISPFPAVMPLWLITSGFLAWNLFGSQDLRSPPTGYTAEIGGTMYGVLAFLSHFLLRI